MGTQPGKDQPTYPACDIEIRDLPKPTDSDAPPKLQRLFAAMQGDAQASFNSDVERLESLVSSGDPVQLLTQMSMDHLMFEGTANPESVLPDALTQWPIEWLQGFCLRYEYGSEQGETPVEPAVAEEIESRLRSIGATSVGERFQRRERAYGSESSERIDGSWEQEQARGARMAIRNWSYRPHMVSIATQLYAPMDPWSEAELGYPLSAVPEYLLALENEVEHRSAALMRQIEDVKMRSASAMDMCERWHASSLPGADQAPALAFKLRHRRLRLKELHAKFEHVMRRHLPDVFMFTFDQLEELSDGRLTRAGIELLMANLSYRFGDLSSIPVEHLTMGNPVWTRPFIALEDGRYFLPIPGMGLSHLLDLVENLVPGESGGGSERLALARASFLERRTTEILVNALPTARHYVNSKFDDPESGAVFENDLAMIVDDVALVVEAKSHRVRPDTWRGAPGGLRRAIENLLLEPSAQSERFARYFHETDGGRRFHSDTDGEFIIDNAGIRGDVRVNVVLDPFPVTFDTSPNLRAAKLLLDGDPDPTPALHMAALESVLLVLPDELQRIHYLARRQVLQRECPLHADELDLLALYLEDGFTLAELSDPTLSLVIRGLAQKQVDPFLEAWFSGQDALPAPLRPLTPMWRQMLERLQEERPMDWVSIGMALLDVPFAQQEALGSRILESLKAMRNSGGLDAIEWWADDIGLSHWQSKLVIVATPSLSNQNADELAGAVVEVHALNAHDSCTVLVVEATNDAVIPALFHFAAATTESVSKV